MTKVLSLYRGVIDRRTLAEIVADATARYDFTVKELRGPSRSHPLVHIRQEVMAEAFDTGRFTMGQIGLYLGGRDHSTVHHGVYAHKSRVGAQQVRAA